MKTIHFLENIQIRLDNYLVSKLELTRNHIQGLIRDEYVLVNDKKVKTGYLLKENDVITIRFKEPAALDIKPVDLNLEITYEDDDLIVVNKPSGLVVHPASSYKGNTLVHGLLHQVENLSGINGIIRPGIVHRIDKDTSGLLLVAKNDFSHNELARQLKNHEIKREYRCLVYGSILESEGKIETNIGRSSKNRKKMAVTDVGKKAITTFKVLERFDGFTFLSCILETGRTHQIRVHMSYIGHPIVGDPLYGPKKVYGNTGQFLHAYLIGFMHPTKKRYLEFTSLLPVEFDEMLNKIREKPVL
ncbi:RluA family pseudouridine synthase [Acholeplasma sp. OttesenSCG-928-E16]|nr:RluA family pseudouridine synthase [Acholeplasma sp. OttesenSCG-928-E16]